MKNKLYSENRLVFMAGPEQPEPFDTGEGAERAGEHLDTGTDLLVAAKDEFIAAVEDRFKGAANGVSRSVSRWANKWLGKAAKLGGKVMGGMENSQQALLKIKDGAINYANSTAGHMERDVYKLAAKGADIAIDVGVKTGSELGSLERGMYNVAGGAADAMNNSQEALLATRDATVEMAGAIYDGTLDKYDRIASVFDAMTEKSDVAYERRRAARQNQ